MGWLINRNSNMAWQSIALSAVVIVLLCSLVSLSDAILLDNSESAIFVLMPVQAFMLACSALITGSALFSEWRWHRWLVTGSAGALCTTILLGAGNFVSGLSDVSLVQLACWLALLMGWLLWFWSGHGKSAILLINGVLLLFSLYLVFSGGAAGALQLNASPVSSLNCAIFISLCALANIGFSLTHPQKLHVQPASLGLLLSLFIACGVTLIWFSNTKKMQHHVSAEALYVTQRIQRNLDNLVQAQQGLLTRLVKRAAFLADNLNERHFQQEAQDYLTDFPYITYLALTTADNTVLRSLAVTASEQSWFDNYLRRRAHSPLQKPVSSAAVASFFVDYDPDIDHTLLYAGYRSGKQAPLMVAVANINYKRVLDNLVADIAPQNVQLIITQREGGELLYQSAQQATSCVKS
jgi:hypothetical protein